jgi:hypothetical protein
VPLSSDLAVTRACSRFWKQLPERLQSKAADIIFWAIEAYVEATALQPPRAVQLQERDEFLRAHAPITDPKLLTEYKTLVAKSYPLTYAMIAELARMLVECLDEISTTGRQHWAEAWAGDPGLGFDMVRSVVEHIAACCNHLDADVCQFQAARAFPPPPRKRGGQSARRVYFDRILKTRFRSHFGQLFPAIIATLEQVAFDLPDAVDESTVLKR